MLESLKFCTSLFLNEHVLSNDTFTEEIVLKALSNFVKAGQISISEDKTNIKILKEDFLETLKLYSDVI